MDELTRERYPFPLPDHEQYARPGPAREVVPARIIRLRRLILCGTTDLEVIEPGGAHNTAIGRDKRLVQAIRAYRDGVSTLSTP